MIVTSTLCDSLPENNIFSLENWVLKYYIVYQTATTFGE